MSNSLGDEIRSLRKSKKLTQSELAEKIGYSRTYLADTESNRRMPSMSFINELAKGLNVSKLYLYKAAGYLNETDILELVNENKRLREALETIAKKQLSDDYSDAYYNEQYFDIVKHARQALEGDANESSTCG